MLETVRNFVFIATIAFALGIAVCVVFILWLLKETEQDY